MGLDRFATFIAKGINNDGIEELHVTSNIRKIVAGHILFDINFLIYQEIFQIENEINDIIKILLCIPAAIDNLDIIEELINQILKDDHWNFLLQKENLIFNGNNVDDIIKNFLSLITQTHIQTNQILSVEMKQILNSIKDFKDVTLLEIIIYKKIITSINHYIKHLHNFDYIISLCLFFDGIPSLSKIIEQRRRRIKNYLESNKKKKLLKTYIDNLELNNRNLLQYLINRNIINDDTLDLTLFKCLYFDYYKWIKFKFIIDKSIGPSSTFIINFQKFIKIIISNLYPKIKLIISEVNENGEADLKIFKYIAIHKISGDYCIHTTDSDLIHQILVQQIYYKIKNIDINLSVIKYLKNTNMIEYVQILDANLIIKNILHTYNNINNIKTNNYQIIWDICLICYLFGNDHLPSSLEIGPELGLEFFLKSHFLALSQNTIVTYIDTLNINLSNFNLLLIQIQKTYINNITKIILQRFFKLNGQLINLFTYEFKFNFSQILAFLEKFIIYKGLQLSGNHFLTLSEDDLRKKLLKNHSNVMIYNTYQIFNLSKQNEILLKIYENSIEENISYFAEEYMGLILYEKANNITLDSYQDIYNYILDKTTYELNNQYPQFYDHLNFAQHIKQLETLDKLDYNENKINAYLKKFFHLIYTQFSCMEDYHTDNITFYKYYEVPTINNIIIYLSKLDSTQIIKKWLFEIEKENIQEEAYFNTTNHQLLISPFISSKVKEFGDNDLEYLIQINKFNYKHININF